VFLPSDESSAWAWLPLGIRDRFDAAATAASVDGDLYFAFGDAAQGSAGFRLTHRQALAGKAEESLGRPAGENRQDVEFALRASHWLGSSVLQPALPPAVARQ
jgi:hypothetical protein